MPSIKATVPGSGPGLWWRSKWMESVFTADDLKPLEVLVAAVYADHAHDKRVSWVTGERLRQRTKLSKDAAHRALKGLETKGYLVAVERRPRRPTTYGLVIPERRLGTPDVLAAGTGDVLTAPPLVRETDQLVREAYSTGTGGVLHPSTYPSSSSYELAPAFEQTGATSSHEEVNNMMTKHACDMGWINNDDGTVNVCPTCKANRRAA